MTDDRRFLSHACLEPKVERDEDGLHLIIPYRNKTLWGSSFRRPLGWTLSNPFSFAKILLRDVGKIEGELLLLLRVRENMYNCSSSAVWGLCCVRVRHTAFIDDA